MRTCLTFIKPPPADNTSRNKLSLVSQARKSSQIHSGKIRFRGKESKKILIIFASGRF